MRATAPVTHERGVSLGREALGWIVTCVVIVGCVTILFADGFGFLAQQWGEPEYSHGWLIPFVTLFVIWSRRKTLLATRDSGVWLGPVLAGLALGILIFSDMAFIRRGPFLAFVLLLYGLGLAGLGRRASRYIVVPLLFLLFAFPLPGSVAVPLSTTLQLISSQLGAGILNLLGISVFLDGNIIDLGVYKLQVAEACSGLRYLFPLASFGFLCAWLYRGPFWARALVLLSTIPITIVLNSGRIALTGLFIEYGNTQLAEGFLHLFEGWIIFLGALLILFALMWLLMRLTGGRTRLLELLDFDRATAALPAGAGGPAADRPHHVPAPLVACAGLLLAVLLAHGTLTHREQIIPHRPGLVTFPLSIEGWTGHMAPIEDRTVLQSLGATDYLLADFTFGSNPAPVNFWVAYYDQQLARAAIHSPKDCLPGGGWEYVSVETIPAPVRTADGRQFMVNRGVVAKGLEQMVIYYWIELRGRQITTDLSLKLYNLWDSYARQRSDGALVRLMSPIAPGEEPEAANRRIEEFLKRAYPLLELHVGA